MNSCQSGSLYSTIHEARRLYLLCRRSHDVSLPLPKPSGSSGDAAFALSPTSDVGRVIFIGPPERALYPLPSRRRRRQLTEKILGQGQDSLTGLETRAHPARSRGPHQPTASASRRPRGIVRSVFGVFC